MKSRIRKKIVDRLVRAEYCAAPYRYKQVLRAYGVGYLYSYTIRVRGRWVYFRSSALKVYPQIKRELDRAVEKIEKRKRVGSKWMIT